VEPFEEYFELLGFDFVTVGPPGGTKTGVKQTEFPSNAISGAITADGLRMAVLTEDNKLHFYDEKLKLLETYKLQSSLSIPILN